MNDEYKKIIKEFFNKKARTWDKNLEEKDIKSLKKIITYIKLKKYNKVLDLGCGTGIAYPYLSKRFKKYIGIDISKEMIKTSRKKFPKAKFITADFEKYNFKEKFDLIFIFNTFPHLLNKEYTIKKAKNILNKCGKIIIAHSLPLRKINQIHKKTNHSIISEQKINSKLIKNLLKKANLKDIKIISKDLFYAEGTN